MSLAEAAANAHSLAMAYASALGIEGTLSRVAPDDIETETRGRTPVFWCAVFEGVASGKLYDGPVVVRINLEAGNVKAIESP
ncbi:hypothetical protein AACH06_29670 [Ideonella sp. DXS29W]|uniref:PepSY domain-containing protein n=1 Tax=Ideonella lacteola TaxID=2984193 RepID=A0ABU9BYE2_9BURK